MSAFGARPQDKKKERSGLQVQRGAGALLVGGGPFLFSLRERLVAL
jgi:hypothetical protein